jgi:protein-tyrosine phosphatase
VIDLHCHLLPGIDDGASDEVTALEMARIALDDGIRCIACTPHIYPGLYENDSGIIQAGLERLRTLLAVNGMDLGLSFGADTHLVPEMLDGLRDGRIPTLNGSRYFLLEPPHHVAPPQFTQLVFNVVAAGYTPLITHPERLTWAEAHYEDFAELVRQGAWIQVTSGAVTGRFGRQARYLAEQMLDDGLVHVIATDAHNTHARRPLLAEGRQAAAAWVGDEEAARMVVERPQAVLDNRDPATVVPPLCLSDAVGRRQGRSWLARLWPF